MPRLNQIDPKSADGPAAAFLTQVRETLGAVPNFLRVFANSPAAGTGFLGLFGALDGGSLDAATRERIALAMAETNSCQYCVSAHTALGKKAGLDDAEIQAARAGGSADAKADAAVKFARAVLDNRGEVSTAELNAVREAGYDDGDVVEIISHVGLNVMTNFIGKVGQIDIDFPKVDLLAA